MDEKQIEYKYIEYVEYEDNSTNKKPTKNISNDCCFIAITITSLILIGMITVLIIDNIPKNNNKNYCKIIDLSEIELAYPYEANQVKYVVNFNKTIMQANYVYYISTSGGNGCPNNKKKFKNDPYGVDPITTKDYTHTGFDRGHLVPNADHGCDTYVIPNIVPMNSSFNRGVWAQSEEYIRYNYAGKLIYKGCNYSDRYIISNLANKLYIPIGCYYIVFDTSELPDISNSILGEILDFGYYLNEGSSQKGSKLPYWISCP